MQPDVIANGLQLAEGKGSGGKTLKEITAVGEGPVNSVTHKSGQEEVKKEDGAVRGAPKHGRFRITKPDEGESCSVYQHCTQRGVKGFSPAAAVDLLMGTQGVAAIRPVTIPSFFRGALKKNARGVALKVKREGEWREYTFQQYWDTVVSVAKSYLKVHRVHKHTDT